MTPRESPDKPPAVELEVIAEARAVVVKLRGEHDLSTEPLVTSALEAAIQRAERVLIDLEHCTFADSTLVKVLSKARTRYTAVRFEAIIPPQASAVTRLAALARLQAVIPVHESREAVLDVSAGA